MENLILNSITLIRSSTFLTLLLHLVPTHKIMMNFRFALIAVMSLLAAHPQCAVASNGKDPTTCFTDVKVDRTDCMKALGEIVFDASGETTVQRISGNCYVQINKPSWVGISQAQVQSSVNKILSSCSPQAGSTKFTVKGAEVLVKLGNRSPKDSWETPFDADFPFDQETCLSVTGLPIRYRPLLEDSVAFDWGRKSEMIIEHNTCQLKFSTSDGSAIVAPIFEVMHAMNKLFKCDKEYERSRWSEREDLHSKQTIMMNFRFALIAVMSLLAAHSQCAVASNGKDPTTCFTDVKVDRTDCMKALGEIVYDASGETTVQRISGNCYVQINKPSWVGISQAQVQSSVNKILSSCSPQAGSTKFTVKGAEVLVKLGNRSPKDSWETPFDADFPYDQETCLSVTGTNPIVIRDCMSASNKIPTVTKEDSVAFDWGRKSEMIIEHNTCQSVHTRSNFPIVSSQAQVQSSVDKILNSCSPQAGSTKLTVKGAEVLVKLGNRSPKDSWQTPFDADFPFDQETCLSVTGTKPIQREDCMQALNNIPFGREGNSVGFLWERKPEMIAQHQSCQLKVSTSDGSSIVAKPYELMNGMSRLFKCDKQWGIISIKGAAGPNGRTYIQMQST
ncbi:hypothetical protein PSTT_00672 [Puccinia striiformis]|uniref:Uncharacterized protein n=1 Tax=Puccinia striiformis TaxID=27350 RepID=A0A2S4W697_9BASI|nr:hypothetical protein PSTT_00672 [Puccinia striiformis]